MTTEMDLWPASSLFLWRYGNEGTYHLVCYFWHNDSTTPAGHYQATRLRVRRVGVKHKTTYSKYSDLDPSKFHPPTPVAVFFFVSREDCWYPLQCPGDSVKDNSHREWPSNSRGWNPMFQINPASITWLGQIDEDTKPIFNFTWVDVIRTITPLNGSMLEVWQAAQVKSRGETVECWSFGHLE